MITKQKLKIGSLVRWEGDTHSVIGFSGPTVQLRSKDGSTSVIALTALVNSIGFSLVQSGNQKAEKIVPSQFENVPEEYVKQAHENLGHLLEAETGYRSGTEEDALKGEPRPEYDPYLQTKTQRYAAKAKELGVSTRAIWVWKNAHKTNGIYGLIDKRITKTLDDQVDIRVKQALDLTIEELVNNSNVTINQISRKTKWNLEELYPGVTIPFPPKSTFQRLFARRSKGQALSLSAKTRRGNNNRPSKAYSHFTASRPGEMVLIDSTPLDVFGMDPISFEWVQVQLTIAYDLFSRSIVAWRFTPVSTKAVDAALLLYDIIRPKWAESNWANSARWAYVGVPETIIVEVTGQTDRTRLAKIPFLHPESIIVDRGKVFLSEAFASACTRLEINLYLARPYTPTDKSHVERLFRSIREGFLENLPGYKGPDVYSRGFDIESEAYLFIDEIERYFAEWVATYWQRRHHDGLELPNIPLLRMSPNEMYEEGIATAGFVYVAPDERIYYDLLPTEWRTVQHYGIEVRGLRYDCEELSSFRNMQSSYHGVNAGKWPIRYDPRDLSWVHFYDTENEAWIEVPWIGRSGPPRPFNESTVRHAKTLVLSKGGNPRNEDELKDCLNGLLNRIDREVIEDKKERKLAAVNAINAQQVAKDRPRQQKNPDAEATAFSSDGPLGQSTGYTELSPKTKGNPFKTRILKSVDDTSDDDNDDELDI